MHDDFTPPPEELQRLADEISLLRRELQAGTAALGRIEKRLKAAFPNYASRKPARRSPPSGAAPVASTKSRDDLLADFDSLITATRDRGDAGFEACLSALTDQDVIALAHELGIGSLKTTSVSKAREGIRKRVQESLLLSFRVRKSS